MTLLYMAPIVDGELADRADWTYVGTTDHLDLTFELPDEQSLVYQYEPIMRGASSSFGWRMTTSDGRAIRRLFGLGKPPTARRRRAAARARARRRAAARKLERRLTRSW